MSTTTSGYDADGAKVLALSSATTVTDRLLNGPMVDQVLADEHSGNTEWLLADNQGTIRNVVNSSGDAVDHLTYNAFGSLVSQSGTQQYGSTDVIFGEYNGSFYDNATGQQFDGAREYNSSLGRWDESDPTGLAAGPNTYEAFGDSPTNNIDPSGLKWTFSRNAYERRATANCECGDTVEELAAETNMDPKQYRNWLQPVNGADMPASASAKIKTKGSYTIPNIVFVGIGKLSGFQVLALGDEPGEISTTLSSKGFKVLYRDWDAAPWTARDVFNNTQDLYGIVYIGHGGKKKFMPIFGTDQSGWLSPSNDGEDYFRPAEFRSGQFGVLIIDACFAGRGGWAGDASQNATNAGAVSVSWGYTIIGSRAASDIAAAKNAK